MKTINAEKPCALILAAGFSSRMKELKPLLPLGKVCLRSVDQQFPRGEIEEICVVFGASGR